MKTLLLASAAVLAACSAHAANIVAFSQTSGSNTVTATVNGADTQTTLTVSDAALSIGQIITGSPPATAYLDLNATSIDAAQTVGGAVVQHYDGTFSITSAPGGGTNILSGSFSDAAFGGLGGPGLVVNVNNPPDALTLTSAVIPANDLLPPNAFSLGFTNLTPALSIVGQTIGPFTASLAGTVSANIVPAPEPASLAVLGTGLIGLGMIRRRT